MTDLSALLENPDHSRFELGDNNNDGIVDIHDLPAEPGSIEAKQNWAVIDAEAHSPAAIAKAKAAGFDDATGWYNGKPLSNELTGPKYNTYQYIVNKVHWFDGLDWDVAQKVASRATKSMEWSE